MIENERSRMWQTTSISDSYRAETEDRFAVLPRGDAGVLLVVADGVGGRFGGGKAAECAVELVTAHAPGIALLDGGRWAALIAYIDGEIADIADAGETTLVVVEASHNQIVGASVGDSSALYFANGGETIDLTEHQQRKPFVGSGNARPLSFALDIPNSAGGAILVASDGLFDYAEPTVVEAAARHADLDEAARRLAVAPRGKFSNLLYDDLTILLARRDATAPNI